MLFLVAIEPYLFNLVFANQVSFLDPFKQSTSALFGVDLGCLFAALGIMDHWTLRPHASDLSADQRKTFGEYRTRHAIAAGIFLLSALPWFGSWVVFDPIQLTARELLWIIPLAIAGVSRRAAWLRALRVRHTAVAPTHPIEATNSDERNGAR